MSAIDSREKKTTHPGEIIKKLRAAAEALAGVKKDVLKRLKELEKENTRLKRLVVDGHST